MSVRISSLGQNRLFATLSKKVCPGGRAEVAGGKADINFTALPNSSWDRYVSDTQMCLRHIAPIVRLRLASITDTDAIPVKPVFSSRRNTLDMEIRSPSLLASSQCRHVANFGRSRRPPQCPLYPQKRTWSEPGPMSPFDPKRT